MKTFKEYLNEISPAERDAWDGAERIAKLMAKAAKSPIKGVGRKNPYLKDLKPVQKAKLPNVHKAKSLKSLEFRPATTRDTYIHGILVEPKVTSQEELARAYKDVENLYKGRTGVEWEVSILPDKTFAIYDEYGEEFHRRDATGPNWEREFRLTPGLWKVKSGLVSTMVNVQ